MMFQRFFPKRPAAEAGKALYDRLIAQARTPAFYLAGRVPDTTDGRFELYTLHLALLTRRLKGEGPFAQEASQALFDAFLDGLDYGLREMGVGDLSVPKRMRKMGAAIYGRFKSYDSALAETAPDSELEALLGRTLYTKVQDAPVADIAAYVREADAQLAAQAVEALLVAPPTWPELRFADALA